MKAALSTFLIGTLFGLGLAVSEMMNPARVIGFLDLTGAWDPTLALVMGGALAVALPGYWFVQRWQRPILEPAFSLPTVTDIDPKLLGGAALFGVGWGLAGLCPGPAIAALSTAVSDPGQFWAIVLFVAAMVAGQWLVSRTLQ